MDEMKERRESAFRSEPLLDIDPKIVRAYQAALDAFNSGNWDATVTSCGKALEGVTKSELPYNERSGTLGQLLEKLPKHIKLEQAMNELAAAIKDSRSLGAHFDLERENSEDVAQATLSLVESFLTYVYLFKAKVHYLIELIDHHAEQAEQDGAVSAERQRPAAGSPPPERQAPQAPPPRAVSPSPPAEEPEAKPEPERQVERGVMPQRPVIPRITNRPQPDADSERESEFDNFDLDPDEYQIDKERWE